MKLKTLLEDKFLILTDQALSSLLNFGSVFLLSKLASVFVFGNFVLAYSYANLIFIFATYFISAPVLVFLPKKWSTDSAKYLVSLLIFNILIIVGISCIGYFILNFQVENVSLLLFLGINSGMIFNDLFKKFIFAGRKISFIYNVVASFCLVFTFFVLVLIYRDSLTINKILLIYTLSFSLSNIILFVSIIKYRLLTAHSFQINLSFGKGIVKDHFHYSKWIIAGGILFWSYSQGIFILGDILGIDELGIGKVRTIQNLLGLFTILVLSMENYYIPLFSSKADELPTPVNDFYKKFKYPFFFIFIISLPVLFYAYEWVYAEKYGSGFWILLIIWVSQIITVYLKPLSMGLKAKEITYPLYITHVAAIIILLTFGVLFIYLWNNIGLALAILAAFLSSNLVLVYFYNKSFRQ